MNMNRVLCVLVAAAWLCGCGAEKRPGMNTTVHREGERVWLTGVEGWAVWEEVSSVRRLKGALPLERQAIDQIKQALATNG